MFGSAFEEVDGLDVRLCAQIVEERAPRSEREAGGDSNPDEPHGSEFTGKSDFPNAAAALNSESNFWQNYQVTRWLTKNCFSALLYM
jgi:hypothetical protein